ncbi:MAG: hypothetical protein KTR20_11050 [Cellvibrionaceae bacterium]|nr:hypothetical protein [Cellvibrionaceae bacterium]
MNYTLEMKNLVMAIRKKAPAEVKAVVRFSNVNLIEEIRRFHTQTDDEDTRALIERLLVLVDKPADAKTGRGNTAEKSTETDSNQPNSKKIRKRIYRGRVIDD